MVAQEGEPPLRGRSTSLGHVLGDAGLSDLKAELEQLAMDARRAPQRIVHAHPLDQPLQVCVDLRPASGGAGFPTPVPAEAGTMPTHEGFGSNDRNELEDRGKPSIQLDQEQAIAVRELDATSHLPPQNGQLMRSAAFSASSRLFDLNGEANRVRKKHNSATIG
jgi:hypothetical protein